MAPDHSRLNDALKPRLKLFLSVDLLGSTAYKQSVSPADVIQGTMDGEDRPTLGSAWFAHLMFFYQAFEKTLFAESEAFETRRQSYGVRSLPKPEFWKSRGDELLFTFEVEDPLQVSAAITIWVTSLENFRPQLRDRAPKLDIKSSAWIAGFPVINSEVIFRPGASILDASDSDAVVSQYQLRCAYYSLVKRRQYGLTRDYIGPQIDTGFRLGEHAKGRRLVLAVDLAMILLSAEAGDLAEKFMFYFDGTEPLKGVGGGRPYPIIWVETSPDAAASLEARSRYRSPDENRASLQKYVRAYMQENADFLLPPFMVDAPHGAFSIIPDNYVNHLLRVQESFPKELTQIETKKESAQPNQRAARKGASIAAKTANEFAAFANAASVSETDPATTVQGSEVALNQTSEIE